MCDEAMRHAAVVAADDQMRAEARDGALTEAGDLEFWRDRRREIRATAARPFHRRSSYPIGDNRPELRYDAAAKSAEGLR